MTAKIPRASADLTSTAITVKVNERPITGEVTYLSDIDWKYAQSGWESVMKDKYCNGASSGADLFGVSMANRPTLVKCLVQTQMQQLSMMYLLTKHS